MTSYGAIEWFGPDSGQGSVEHVVSAHQDTVDAVRKAAQKVARDAEFVLFAHRDTGDAKIGVIHDMEQAEHGPQRLIDSVIYLAASDITGDSDGEDNGGNSNGDVDMEDVEFRAPNSIEFGFTTSSKKGGAKKWPGVAPLRTAVKKSIRERKLSIK